MLWSRTKAAAMESTGMTPRNAAGARDSVSAGQKPLIQQLLSFPQPFTISRPKLYNPLLSKSPIGLFKICLSFFFSNKIVFFIYLQVVVLIGRLRFNSLKKNTLERLTAVNMKLIFIGLVFLLQESDNSNFDSL